MKYTVIICAAGISNRFKKDKLLVKLRNEFLIKHTIYPFYNDNDCEKIVLVVHVSKINFYKNLFRLISKLIVVEGGISRHQSVINGLNYCTKSEYVLIHDGCRPYLTDDLLSNIKNNLISNDVVIPVINEFDSLIQINNNQLDYLDRNMIKRVQTPQAFKTRLLLELLNQTLSSKCIFNDEFSWLINSNLDFKYVLIDGDYKNIKITIPTDIDEISYDEFVSD